MGTRTFFNTPNPKSASCSHLGTKETASLTSTPEWFGIESLYESSGSLFKVDAANCYKLYTSTECVYASMCRALQRNSQNFEAGIMVTSYCNCTRFSIIDLSLNSNYILKMKTLCPPFTVSPTITPLLLRKQEPEKPENLKQNRRQRARFWALNLIQH